MVGCYITQMCIRDRDRLHDDPHRRRKGMLGLPPCCASSEFFKNGIYDYSIFAGENGKKRTADEQIAYLEDLIKMCIRDRLQGGINSPLSISCFLK